MNINNPSNGAHFLPHGMAPYQPSGFDPNGGAYGQTMAYNTYQPGVSEQIMPPQSAPIHYPPATPPHLTHSRRGSRESRDSSSSQSTPSTGASGPGTHGGLVHRHKRGHLSSSVSPPSPTTILRKPRRPKKKDQIEDLDDGGLSDEDPASSQKIRREDAKKSRQDAEQKRRDQLKGAYDQLRLVVPGSTEKTSKVMLVNHARQHIEKLTRERHDLLVRQERNEDDLHGLRLLNERLLKKLMDHGVDFKEDLEATGMELPPTEELQRALQPFRRNVDAVPPTVSIIPSDGGQHGSQVPASGPQYPPPHSNGHSRTSSNVSMGNFGSEAGLAMSAPLHSVPLTAAYTSLPPSMPTTPIRPSVLMGPPSATPQGGAPHLRLTLPGGSHSMSSPTSSMSSASASAGQHLMFSAAAGQGLYGVEDGSGTRPPGSMIGLDQVEYMQQRHAPHQPYEGNGAASTNEQSFPHQSMVLSGGPGVGQEANGGPGMAAGLSQAGTSSAMGGSQPEKSGFIFPPGPQHHGGGGPPAFGNGERTGYRADGREGSHFAPTDFAQYAPRDDRHPAQDMYHHPGTPGGGQVLSPGGQQPGGSLLQVPQHGSQTLAGSAGGAQHSTSPKQQSDRSGAGHSPLLGSFGDGSHQGTETGISPSMLGGM